MPTTAKMAEGLGHARGAVDRDRRRFRPSNPQGLLDQEAVDGGARDPPHAEVVFQRVDFGVLPKGVVFARALRTKERTLENREQGCARPNAQAAVLIRLVESYPDTLDRLAEISQAPEAANMGQTYPGLWVRVSLRHFEGRLMVEHQQIRLCHRQERISLPLHIRELHQKDGRGKRLHNGADLPALQSFLGEILH